MGELVLSLFPGIGLLDRAFDYTFVNPRKVASPNPGYCFIAAGWRPCGWTKGGLRILECAA